MSTKVFELYLSGVSKSEIVCNVGDAKAFVKVGKVFQFEGFTLPREV